MADRAPGAPEQEIRAVRRRKPGVDWRVPVSFLAEPEIAQDGRPALTGTVFLANRECPFQCLMCDLWQFTTEGTVPPGAIQGQIEFALARLPKIRKIKLYNSGNFFDRKAVPPGDLPGIAQLLARFDTVIVENHPRLTDRRAVEFARRLDGRFEVALGLETAHPDVLARLNKRMTVEDFQRAAGFLRDHDLGVRAFLLLWPPFLDEESGLEWTLTSVLTAFEGGADVVVLIPLRPAPGPLEALFATGEARSPDLRHIEAVFSQALNLRSGRVFVDLWDIHRIVRCPRCGPARVARLREANLTQRLPAPIKCVCTS